MKKQGSESSSPKRQPNPLEGRIGVPAQQENAPAAQLSITTRKVVRREGPLPDPETLKEYDLVLPGSAREIIDMAKAEQTQRHLCENRAINSHVLGQWFGFLLGSFGVIGGLALVYSGKSIEGFGAFFFSLAALVGTAIWKQKTDSK